MNISIDKCNVPTYHKLTCKKLKSCCSCAGGAFKEPLEKSSKSSTNGGFDKEAMKCHLENQWKYE